MPYITQSERDEFEEMQDRGMKAVRYLSELPLDKFAGYLNYHIYSIVKAWLKANKRKYFACAVIVGTLVCCVLEIYRCVVAPYEDEKIKSNGDVS